MGTNFDDAQLARAKMPESTRRYFCLTAGGNFPVDQMSEMMALATC
jgi:hypothetical protein